MMVLTKEFKLEISNKFNILIQKNNMFFNNNLLIKLTDVIYIFKFCIK
jgi:hypothetical protein